MRHGVCQFTSFLALCAQTCYFEMFKVPFKLKFRNFGSGAAAMSQLGRVGTGMSRIHLKNQPDLVFSRTGTAKRLVRRKQWSAARRNGTSPPPIQVVEVVSSATVATMGPNAALRAAIMSGALSTRASRVRRATPAVL